MARLGPCGELKGRKDLGFATWVLRLGWCLDPKPRALGRESWAVATLAGGAVGGFARGRLKDDGGEKHLPPHAEDGAHAMILSYPSRGSVPASPDGTRSEATLGWR